MKNDPNKNRELALFLTVLMMLAVGAFMLGAAIVGFMVMIGEQIRTWFQ